jgi:Ser/Thr protein kinase RdoA (MazF antagonist)
VTIPSVRLDAAFLCAEHVAKSGFANVPRFIRTRYGDPYVRHATGQYYMTRWWPGKELDVQSADELFAALRVLGEWHLAARGGLPADVALLPPPSFAERLRRLHSDLVRYRQIAEAERGTTQFSRLFDASADELQRWVEAALENLTEPRFFCAEAEWAANGWVCHGDFTRHNLTFDGAAYTVWNYDKVHPGLPLVDAALFLHRSMPTFDWAPDVLGEAVQRYRESAPGAGEPALLAALLSVPLRTMQVVSRYYQRTGNWDEEDLVDALESSLELDLKRRAACHAVFAEDPLQVTLATDTAAQAKVEDPAHGEQGEADKASPERRTQERQRSRNESHQQKRSKRAARAKSTAGPNAQSSRRAGVDKPKVWGSVTPTDGSE